MNSTALDGLFSTGVDWDLICGEHRTASDYYSQGIISGPNKQPGIHEDEFRGASSELPCHGREIVNLSWIN